MKNTKAPHHIELVQLWLENHFANIACVVFFDPLGDGSRVDKFIDKFGLSGSELSDLINCDLLIIPNEKSNSVTNSLEQKEWGFVMAWNGKEFTTENR